MERFRKRILCALVHRKDKVFGRAEVTTMLDFSELHRDDKVICISSSNHLIKIPVSLSINRIKDMQKEHKQVRRKWQNKMYS